MASCACMRGGGGLENCKGGRAWVSLFLLLSLSLSLNWESSVVCASINSVGLVSQAEPCTHCRHKLSVFGQICFSVLLYKLALITLERTAHPLLVCTAQLTLINKSEHTYPIAAHLSPFELPTWQAMARMGLGWVHELTKVIQYTHTHTRKLEIW